MIQALRSRSARTGKIRHFSRLLRGVGLRWPRRGITKASHKRRETLEIAVVRDERDALFAARCRNQRIIDQRRILVEQLPPFALRDCSDDATALDERGGGRREYSSSAFEWLEYALLHLAYRFTGPCARRKFLHHDRAQMGEWKSALEERENRGLSS